MENLFDLEAGPTEAAASNNISLYPPPDRACLVCGLIAWRWDPNKQAYVCDGNQTAHDAYAAWHKATFPWLA